MILAGELDKEKDASAKLSYALYRMTKREPGVKLDSGMLKNLIKSTDLPNPQEQLDNLILWLGEKLSISGISSRCDVLDKRSASAISAAGAKNINDVRYVVSQAIEVGLMRGKVEESPNNKLIYWFYVNLTLKGWELFERLKRGKASGRNAFMAMPFDDPDLDKIFTDHFKSAVKATGFDLKRLDEGQPAGLIDDRLRVEIRQSRFLIADLTHNNNGAYWEAGYAEGLGKPVIYTCRKDVFDNPQKGTHFDTNHHLTVVWEPDKLPEAVEKLKATIRATLPEEAKQSD
jgi:hypothetical protein